MKKKTLASILVCGTILVYSYITVPTPMAEAGEFSVQYITIVVDDSSVYHVGKNHVRVAFRSISNYRTGAYIPDVADVIWGEEYVVSLGKDYAPEFERELKWKIAKYCRDNYM
ncbi:hypothetical protein [Selenomonas ruminantium]|uniref:Uncharacterized protein n=1 Tax=Selenomonas ruminantium TaxID=971 RepID=A0A1H3ZWX5_SELRU|nr:hypothetical protein [Selenomonas ruminantium]SEA28206.1 hypothetical protein SAMN05660648_02619 [Selenomonas ruminantium]